MDLVHIEKAVVTVVDRRVAQIDADCEPIIVEQAGPGYDPFHAGRSAVPVPANAHLLRQIAADLAGRLYLSQCTRHHNLPAQTVRAFLLDPAGQIIAHGTAAQSQTGVETEIKHINREIERLRQQRDALSQLSHGFVSDRQVAVAAGFSHTHIAKIRATDPVPPTWRSRIEDILIDAGLPLATHAAALSDTGRPDGPHLKTTAHLGGKLVTLRCAPVPDDEHQAKALRVLADRAVDVLRDLGYRLDPVNSVARTTDERVLDLPAYQLHPPERALAGTPR